MFASEFKIRETAQWTTNGMPATDTADTLIILENYQETTDTADTLIINENYQETTDC